MKAITVAPHRTIFSRRAGSTVCQIALTRGDNNDDDGQGD
jgi:hypothetical protein